MSILELFDNEFKKRNRDHFAAIVRVAMSDDIITEGEKTFLDRLARNLNITDAEYKLILNDYMSHPINPPVSYDLRLERLYDLTRMVLADNVKNKDEEKLVRKFCVGLGFHAVNVKYICQKAIDLVRQGDDLEEFIYGIKNMNQ